jgi:hypothetical protein
MMIERCRISMSCMLEVECTYSTGWWCIGIAHLRMAVLYIEPKRYERVEAGRSNSKINAIVEDMILVYQSTSSKKSLRRPNLSASQNQI